MRLAQIIRKIHNPIRRLPIHQSLLQLTNAFESHGHTQEVS